MLTRSLTAALTLLVATSAVAGSDSFFVVVATTAAPRVAAVLRQPADFVSVGVTLRSDEDDAAERFSQVGAAKSALVAEVAKHEGWQLRDGPLALSGETVRKWSSSGGGSTADVTLLVPLRESSNVYAESAAVVRAIAAFQKSSEDVKVYVDRFSLAVRDPQQYRPQILKLVAAEAARTRDGVAPGGRTTLSRLEGPVLVRQVDERNVELFIDYRLTVESAPKR